MPIQLKTLGAALLLGGLMSACSTTAEPGAESVADNKDKVTCRIEGDTGSRIAKRTCRTVGEWEAIADANVEAVRNQKRGAVGGEAPVEQGRAR